MLKMYIHLTVYKLNDAWASILIFLIVKKRFVDIINAIIFYIHVYNTFSLLIDIFERIPLYSWATLLIRVWSLIIVDFMVRRVFVGRNVKNAE